MTGIATRYEEYVAHQGWRARLRSQLRDTGVAALSVRERIDRTTGWIRFPVYHHVFDDEVAGFERQVRYMRRFGDFISFDDAIALVVSGGRLDGRYFCLAFDDGYRNCFTNALPVLDHLGIPAAFFVITDLIGTSVGSDRPLLERHFAGSALVEFMDWQECRDMTRAGMVIGSHTMSHPNLMRLDDETVRRELSQSKAILESRLDTSCDHFCCPFGISGANFRPDREPAIAADAGYCSFATGMRGAMRSGDSPFFVKRDQLLANWNLSQVRYFLRG